MWLVRSIHVAMILDVGILKVPDNYQHVIKMLQNKTCQLYCESPGSIIVLLSRGVNSPVNHDHGFVLLYQVVSYLV